MGHLKLELSSGALLKFLIQDSFQLLSEVKVTQACLTLCNPMDYTVHGILQARILEWVELFPSPGDPPNPGIKPRSPELQVDSLPSKSPGKPKTEQKYTHRDRRMLSCDRFFATLWTVACQAPLWDSPGKNTGVGCYALLQGIFLTQGSNSCLLCLLHCRQIPYLLSRQGSPHDNKHIINTFIYLFQSQGNL